MNTTESFPAPRNLRPSFGRRQRPNPRRGISLVEVMVAATVFTVMALSVTALYLQNQRAAVSLRYRTQITNTALNILEQMRLKNYSELKTLRDDSLAAPTLPHRTMVLIADPSYVPPTPDPYASLNLPAGLRPVELSLNVVDGTVIETSRTVLDIPMEIAATATKLKTRYWLTLKFNESRTTPRVQAIEIALVYQWRMPQRTDWIEGTVRLVVTNPQAIKDNTPANSP